MKLINYVGTEGDCIVIQKPEDLYPLLDWFQTNLMDLGFDEEAHKVEEFMKMAEKNGLGSYDDVEDVDYN